MDPAKVIPSLEDRDGRPFEFLVAAPGCARDVAGNMGNADYSYSFVLRALTPVLECLGRWKLVGSPESSLMYQAELSLARGFRPVQLAIQPPQNCFFTPAVPTIVFPFWEFPDLPSRDLAHDTRQNWVRMLSRADLILTACQFTADSIRRAGIERPVAVVPVPLAPTRFEVESWDPRAGWHLDCRHALLGGPATGGSSNGGEEPRPPLWKRAARRGFRRLKGVYQNRVTRWLSPEAIERLFQMKNRILRRMNEAPPLLPTGRLTLSGLVYTSVFNLGDRRKNVEDMLSAFLLAFRDRPDVTLVLKLATNPAREHHEMKELRHRYDRVGIDHACRVAVITDYLSDAQMGDLMRATTYYLNTSRAEGACLPLQEAMAAGRPVLAPRHTAMLDYIDEEVAFVLPSHEEPTFFPHDPDPRLETSWHRLVWTGLKDQLVKSAEVAEHDPERYFRMADRSRARMSEDFGQTAAAEALVSACGHLARCSGTMPLAWSA